MKRVLTIVKAEIYHIVNGERKTGAPPNVWGNLTNVWGDLSNVWGNLTNVWGDLSNVWGDLTNVRGDLSRAEITAKDRKKGIDIKDLIKK